MSFRQACVSLVLLSGSLTARDVQFREGSGMQGRTRGSVPAELARQFASLAVISEGRCVRIPERFWLAAVSLAVWRYGTGRTTLPRDCTGPIGLPRSVDCMSGTLQTRMEGGAGDGTWRGC